jgi:hypothetical protein
MIKGYFPHKHPNLIPSAFGFAFVLGKIGIVNDPAFSLNWDKVKSIRRGIYQRPVVTAENDAYNHSAFLIELCNYNNPDWDDMPLLLNIMQPNVDLTFINTWVSQIVNCLHPKEKPLLYTTPSHWENIQKGPNAEVVSKTILQSADIFSSEFKVKLPGKVLYVDKLKYWEHELGKMQYASDGVFAVQEQGKNAPETGNLPGSTVESVTITDVTLHITCPHCSKRIF